MANFNSLSRDEIYELIKGYDYRSIINFCRVNPYIANICKNDQEMVYWCETLREIILSITINRFQTH